MRKPWTRNCLNLSTATVLTAGGSATTQVRLSSLSDGMWQSRWWVWDVWVACRCCNTTVDLVVPVLLHWAHHCCQLTVWWPCSKPKHAPSVCWCVVQSATCQLLPIHAHSLLSLLYYVLAHDQHWLDGTHLWFLYLSHVQTQSPLSGQVKRSDHTCSPSLSSSTEAQSYWQTTQNCQTHHHHVTPDESVSPLCCSPTPHEWFDFPPHFQAGGKWKGL